MSVRLCAQMACGSHHAAVTLTTGELYTWGTGSFGRLGTRGVKLEHVAASATRT